MSQREDTYNTTTGFDFVTIVSLIGCSITVFDYMNPTTLLMYVAVLVPCLLYFLHSLSSSDKIEEEEIEVVEQKDTIQVVEVQEQTITSQKVEEEEEKQNDDKMEELVEQQNERAETTDRATVIRRRRMSDRMKLTLQQWEELAKEDTPAVYPTRSIVKSNQ
jgi:uncharacterized protein (DUF58 family)